MCNKMNTSILVFSVINIYIVLHVQIMQKQVFMAVWTNYTTHVIFYAIDR